MLMNLGSNEQLNQAVWDLNQALRWSRVDIALGYVKDDFRATFIKYHAHWAHNIEVGDIEIQAVTTDNPVRSVVQFSWYRLSQMDIHHTVIEQRWKRSGGSYKLAKEWVTSGDASLLVAPPPKAKTTAPSAAPAAGAAPNAAPNPMRTRNLTEEAHQKVGP